MDSFIEISKYAGMRCDLVQAGGGNTSVKLDDYRMLVKSSGVQMADVTRDKGYSIVNYRSLVDYMDQLVKNSKVAKGDDDIYRFLISGNKPSIETYLHGFTEKLTLHTHPLSVNILASSPKGMEILKELFPEGLFLSYTAPGLPLAAEIYKKLLESHKKYNLIFLANHGLIVSGKTAEEVIDQTEQVLTKIDNYLGIDSAAYRIAYEIYLKFKHAGFSEDMIVVKTENKYILDTLTSNGCNIWDHQFCPDCLVYCGKKAMVYTCETSEIDIKKFVAQFGEPVVIVYKNHVYIRANSIKKAREIEDVFAFSAQIAAFHKEYPVQLLSEEEQNYILSWDAEKYRKQL